MSTTESSTWSEPKAAGKLCVRKGRKTESRPIKHALWLNLRSERELHAIRSQLRVMIGRDVVPSIIFRRALELLSEHLEQSDEDVEMAALLKHALNDG